MTNAFLVLGLVVAVAYIITQFSTGQSPQYDIADLTPQKYKTTLEREKAMLADQVDNQSLVTKQGGADSEKTSSVLKDETDKIAPDDSSTASDTGTIKTDEGAINAAVEIPHSMQRNGAVAPERSEDDQPADAAPMHRTHPVKEAQTASATGEAADPSGESATVEPDSDREPVAKIEPLPLKDEKITIPFGINSNEIDARFYAVLDQVAAYLVKNPRKFVFIRGYTDTSGSPGYNETVSRFRANAVKSYLIGKGAYPEKIAVIAMGDKDPIASNASYEGRIKKPSNRN